MTPKDLSAIWTSMAPGLANHVWQSTLFATAAAMLTLVLRNSQARTRYWIWLAASLKFLIPFSLLMSLGSRVPWPRTTAPASAGLYFAMEQVSQPFAQATMPVMSQVSPAIPRASWLQLAPAFLGAIWLCGCAGVLLVWWLRWRRLSASIRQAAALSEGREVEALRRVERMRGIRSHVELRLSRTSLEPGIFGITRPVLVWPRGISERLDDAHLEAVIAHELWHVRRRDNLAAMLHMLVETVFWFHPLVWWLGTRLVEERERACDEEVLELGSERQVYAESILRVCEFCLGSPLPCVSGVTGADLKKRIVHIMNEQVARKLNFGKKLLLTAVGVLAIALPIVVGMVNATPSRAAGQDESRANVGAFAVASIKPVPSTGVDLPVRILFSPDSFVAENVSLQTLLREVYGVEGDQISGAPDWVNSDKFTVQTKLGPQAAAELQNLSPEQHKRQVDAMLQALLADRFKLAMHREPKVLPVYALVLAKSGPKLQPSQTADSYANRPDGKQWKGLMAVKDGQVAAQGLPMADLAQALSRRLGRQVIDQTGLKGNYDFTLRWPAAESQAASKGAEGQPGTESAPDANNPSVLTALQEQLGLELQPQNRSMDLLVIDHVEKPNAD